MKGRHIALAVFAASAIGLVEGTYTPRPTVPYDPVLPACTVAHYDSLDLAVRDAIDRLTGYPEHDFPRDVIVFDTRSGRIGWIARTELSPHCQAIAVSMPEDAILLQD